MACLKKEKAKMSMDDFLSEYSQGNKIVNNAIDDYFDNGKKVKPIYIGKIDESTSKKIKDEFGVDIENKNRFFDIRGIVHSQKKHGKDEKSADQLALTKDDYKQVPYILDNYDDVYYKQTTGKGGRIVDSIVYVKKIGDVYYTVMELSQRGNKATFINMWKKDKVVSRRSQASSQINANSKSSPDYTTTTSNDNSISKNSIKHNSFIIPIPDPDMLLKWLDAAKKRYVNSTVSKMDTTIDIAFDTIMSGFDLLFTPIKYGLSAMGNPIDPSSNWFDVSETTKQISQVINDHRNVKATIYENAGQIKDFLSTLSKDDSKSLVHALGGDIEPDSLSPKLKELYTRFRDVIDEKAQKLVELGALKEENKINDYLKRYYTQYNKEGHHGSKLAYEKLKKRKDLTVDERIALGMLEDADFVIAQTIAEQNVQIEKAKTLQSIADKFGSDVELDNYVRISDETAGGGIKKWGALAGKWIHKDVKAELDNANLVAQQLGIAENYLYPTIDHLKVNMTVKNPVTHVYNIASNILLAGLNGDMKALGNVLYMRSKDPKKFKVLVQKANKYGLNSYLDDFEQSHIELMPNSKDTNIVSTIWKNLYMTTDSKVGKKARDFYDWEDKIFKIAAFNKLLEDGVPEKEAYKQAVEVYVDYSTPLPAGVRILDKSGLMPFLHYQYKSTPAVAKVMAKHPVRATLMAGGSVLLGASAWTNDEEELMTPDWANDKFNLFGVAEQVRLGNGWYLNAGRMIPGTKFEFEFGGILKGVWDIVSGKTPLGYNIGNKYDSLLEKYGKRVLAMAEHYLPSATLGRYMQRGVQIGLSKVGVVDAKKNYYDEDMTFTELAGRAMGVRKFNEKKELKSKQRKAKNELKHKNKEKGLTYKDKKEHKKDYDAKARRIKQASKKVGFDLTATKKSDSFGFDPKFDL